MMQQIMTVRGPIDPAGLGITLAHEHVLIDLTCLWEQGHEEWQRSLTDALPTLRNRGLLYRDPYVSRPNLRLDEIEVAAAELRLYRDLGGRSLIDMTTHGIDPRPEQLRRLSSTTGVQIVMGCGFYVQCAHPPGLSTMSVDDLTEVFLNEIQHGVDGTDVLPGIIGEIGTGSPIHPAEERVLRAAAAAQQRTGLAINVHVAIFAREALHVLDILETAGANLSRVVISHLDEMLDAAYHRAVLERGAYVEFDTFGSEFYFDSSGQREPSDAERIEALLRLLDEGWVERLLLSQDVCNKTHLLRYGGFGYGHILRSIVPLLRLRGVDQSTVETMLIANPARVLTHEKAAT